MKAVLRREYGSPAVLELGEADTPEPGDDDVLVRVRAASVNRLDWYSLTGTPWIGRPAMGLRRPKSCLLGTDFAGTVEAVGRNVTELARGDEVYGGRSGSFAEYVAVRDGVARKPANLSFEEAAAVPVAGLTALQGLRDQANLQPGEKVLVNGSSGGVGTFAVQIGKALGAHVTAVCSTAKVEQARELGADRVVDYTREDFTRCGERYDVLFDNAGSRSWRACRRVLEREATVVLVGGPKRNRLLGPLGHFAAVRIGSAFSSRSAGFFLAKITRADLAVLRELIEVGKVRPAVERRYELSEIGAAIGYVGEGHACGKVVVTVSSPATS